MVSQQIPYLPAQAVAALQEMLRLYSPLEATDAAAIVLDRALAREATLLSCAVEVMRSTVSFLEMLDMTPRQVPSARSIKQRPKSSPHACTQACCKHQKCLPVWCSLQTIKSSFLILQQCHTWPPADALDV